MARFTYEEDDDEAHGCIVKIAAPRPRRGMIRNEPPPQRPRRPPPMYCGDEVANGTRREVLAVGRCQFCGGEHELTVDHIVPRSQGGRSHRANLQCLCQPCNNWKGSRIMSVEQYFELPRRLRRKLARLRAKFHSLAAETARSI